MGQIPQNIMKMIKGMIILDNYQFNDINLIQEFKILIPIIDVNLMWYISECIYTQNFETV